MSGKKKSTMQNDNPSRKKRKPLDDAIQMHQRRYLSEEKDWKFLTTDCSCTLMVMPSKYNKEKRHTNSDDDEYVESKFPKNSWDMFHNLVNYTMLQSYEALGTSPSSDDDRWDFITSIIIQWDQLNIVPITYDESKEKYYIPDPQHIGDEIRKALNSIKQRKMQSKSSVHQNQCTTVKGLQFDEYESRLNFEHDAYPQGTKADALHTMQEVQNWSYYSVIHSLYEPFALYLYPYSHRIKKSSNTFIHQCTKVKLLFPKSPNMYVIFHARLVHSGAESKTVIQSSLVPSLDERIFAYVTVDDKQSVAAAHTSRSNRKGKDYNDKVERDGIQLCNYHEAPPCAFCEKRMDHDYFTIDLGRVYQMLKSKTKDMKRKPILGDMDRCGFEVWSGVNTRDRQGRNLRVDLGRLYYNSTKNSWKCLDNNTQRKALTVFDSNSLDATSHKRDNQSVKTFIQKLTKSIQAQVFQDNKHCELKKVSVLANHGHCAQQLVHRDYPDVEKN